MWKALERSSRFQTRRSCECQTGKYRLRWANQRLQRTLQARRTVRDTTPAPLSRRPWARGGRLPVVVYAIQNLPTVERYTEGLKDIQERVTEQHHRLFSAQCEHRP